MNRWLIKLAVMVASVAVCKTMYGTTMAFDSNVAGAATSFIISDSPNSNYQSFTTLQVAGNGNAHSLVKFNVNDLAGDYQSIDAITLRLTSSFNTSNTGVIDIHQVLADWIESEVTYNNRVTGTAWTTAGGDFDATVLGSVARSDMGGSGSLDGIQVQILVSLLAGPSNAAARLALIDAWTTGGADFGLLVKMNSEPAVGFAGFRDNSRTDAGDRPQLTIEYTPVPEPAGFCLLASGIACVGLIRRNKHNRCAV